MTPENKFIYFYKLIPLGEYIAPSHFLNYQQILSFMSHPPCFFFFYDLLPGEGIEMHKTMFCWFPKKGR